MTARCFQCVVGAEERVRTTHATSLADAATRAVAAALREAPSEYATLESCEVYVRDEFGACFRCTVEIDWMPTFQASVQPAGDLPARAHALLGSTS